MHAVETQKVTAKRAKVAPATAKAEAPEVGSTTRVAATVLESRFKAPVAVVTEATVPYCVRPSAIWAFKVVCSASEAKVTAS